MCVCVFVWERENVYVCERKIGEVCVRVSVCERERKRGKCVFVFLHV